MDQEQHIQPQPDKDNSSRISCETFFSSLEKQKIGCVVEVDRLPSKEEIINAASNPFEIIVIHTDDGSTYVSKGEESDTRFEDVRQQIGGKKIKVIGHTHPFRDEGSKEKSMFYSSLPSAGDLTSRGSGADQEYIFNTFGRIAFSTMDNLGPQSEDGMGAKSMSQSIVNNAMRVAAKEAKQQGIQEIPKIINFLGEYMERKFGTGFKYESWNEVENPFSI